MRVLRSAAAALALAACAPARAPEPLTAADLRRAGSGGEVLVLARFHRADTGEGIFVGGQTASVPAHVTRMEDGQSRRFGATTASAEAGARGWVLQPLPPGNYYMTLGSGGGSGGAGHTYTFWVPPAPGAAYIGSFPFGCVYTVDRPCDDIRPPLADPEEARPPLPEGTGAARTHLATPFARETVIAGWPMPSSITAGIDSVAVQSAINWEDFVSRDGSRRTFRTAGGIAAIGVYALEGREVGAIVAAPFFAASLGTVAIGGLVAGAEGIHRAVVEHQWQPCLVGLSAQTAPTAVGPRLSQALAVTPPAVPRGADAVSAAPWRVDVTRIVLRRCATAGEYAVEVAARWTAPRREARFLRQVPGAPPMPELTFPSRMPWENQAGGPATCRPLAEYCQAGGPPLVADAVVEALVAERNALLAGR